MSSSRFLTSSIAGSTTVVPPPGACGASASLSLPISSGLRGVMPERVRQRVGAEQLVRPRVARAFGLERLLLGDEHDLADQRLGLQQALDAVDVALLDVGLEVDVGDHLVADLVGRAGGGLHDRDEDAEHEHGDEHGGHRGEARDRVALERADRLAQEEDRPHRWALRMRIGELARGLAGGVRARLLVADDLAVGELDHAPAHLVHHRHVVGGDQHRRAGLVDPVDQLHDPDRGLGIEVAGRLVGDQQRRVVDERARDRDALLLAAGELVGIVVELGGEPGEAQDVRHLVADLAAAAARDLERVRDVLVDRAVRQQLVVLEDHAEVAAVVRHARARDLGHVAAGDADLARGRLGLLDQQPHRRRLARAGLADEEDELARVDVEARCRRARRRSRCSASRRR